MILDDLVLDVGKYAEFHPGGTFLIEQTVGRDVSKFFHGGHALDGNSSDPKVTTERYSHTNVARIIANGMAIAVYAGRVNTPKYIGYINHKLTHNWNEHTATYTFDLFTNEKE